MVSIIKRGLKQTFINDVVQFLRRREAEQKLRADQEKEIRTWEAMGKPMPVPHIVKERIVKDYATRFSLDTFIETGTYLGDMVEAMKRSFSKVFSVELDEDLYRKARERFRADANVSIIQGDSGEVLKEILEGISEPCLFWLDGHYSAGITARGSVDTPISEELSHIFNHQVSGHVILIDDARLFVGQDNYPRMDELRQRIMEGQPDSSFEVADDIIRIHRKLN